MLFQLIQGLSGDERNFLTVQIFFIASVRQVSCEGSTDPVNCHALTLMSF